MNEYQKGWHEAEPGEIGCACSCHRNPKTRGGCPLCQAGDHEWEEQEE